VQTTVAGFGGGRADSFTMADPFEVIVLPLQDAKDMLNIPQSDTSSDTEILRKIATITVGFETITGGPIITRQITNERLRVGSGYRTLTVRYRPLVSVVSIADVASGVALSLSDLDVDTATGVIRRKLELPFWSWGPYYLVTYTAGLGTAVPAPFNEAAALTLDNLWQTQRSGVTVVPGVAADELVTVPGVAFGLLPRVVELLRPYALEAYF